MIDRVRSGASIDRPSSSAIDASAADGVSYSNDCGGCACEALGPDEVGSCDKPDTYCLVDPCMDQEAVCVTGQCVLVDAATL